MQASLYNTCRAALAAGLVRSAPHVRVDGKGYVSIKDNLIEGVARGDFEADLSAGDGNELAEKFRAAHSSSSVVVNSFAPFRARPTALRLPGGEAFSGVCFERKCPHGLPGRRPPNLDVLAEGTDGIVAVESKCLERGRVPQSAS